MIQTSPLGRKCPDLAANYASGLAIPTRSGCRGWRRQCCRRCNAVMENASNAGHGAPLCSMRQPQRPSCKRREAAPERVRHSLTCNKILASRALARGESPSVVRRLLGHNKIDTTSDTYIWHGNRLMRLSRDRTPRVLPHVSTQRRIRNYLSTWSNSTFPTKAIAVHRESTVNTIEQPLLTQSNSTLTVWSRQ